MPQGIPLPEFGQVVCDWVFEIKITLCCCDPDNRRRYRLSDRESVLDAVLVMSEAMTLQYEFAIVDDQ